MFKRFVDLKKHYGTETMLEVILDANRRNELTDRSLYKDGRVVRMFISEAEGLVAYDYNEIGIGVVRVVTEPFLEALMISSVDFACIVGPMPKDTVRLDLEEVIEEAIKTRDDNEGTDAIGVAIILTLCIVTSVSYYFGVKPTNQSPPPKPKPKR